MPQGGLALLLRLSKSWHDGISGEDLYEITRAWWVMSPANAQRVERVLAAADGVVREVYWPTHWLPSPVEGLENRPDLQDKTQRTAQEKIVEAEHADFFDHTAVEAILGPDLKAKSYAPGAWLGFNPYFVYRHRPVKPAASTAILARALASMTKRVDNFADKARYDS